MTSHHWSKRRIFFFSGQLGSALLALISVPASASQANTITTGASVVAGPALIPLANPCRNFLEFEKDIRVAQGPDGVSSIVAAHVRDMTPEYQKAALRQQVWNYAVDDQMVALKLRVETLVNLWVNAVRQSYLRRAQAENQTLGASQVIGGERFRVSAAVGGFEVPDSLKDATLADSPLVRENLPLIFEMVRDNAKTYGNFAEVSMGTQVNLVAAMLGTQIQTSTEALMKKRMAQLHERVKQAAARNQSRWEKELNLGAYSEEPYVFMRQGFADFLAELDALGLAYGVPTGEQLRVADAEYAARIAELTVVTGDEKEAKSRRDRVVNIQARQNFDRKLLTLLEKLVELRAFDIGYDQEPLRPTALAGAFEFRIPARLATLQFDPTVGSSVLKQDYLTPAPGFTSRTPRVPPFMRVLWWHGAGTPGSTVESSSGRVGTGPHYGLEFWGQDMPYSLGKIGIGPQGIRSLPNYAVYLDRSEKYLLANTELATMTDGQSMGGAMQMLLAAYRRSIGEFPGPMLGLSASNPFTADPQVANILKQKAEGDPAVQNILPEVLQDFRAFSAELREYLQALKDAGHLNARFDSLFIGQGMADADSAGLDIEKVTTELRKFFPGMHIRFKKDPFAGTKWAHMIDADHRIASHFLMNPLGNVTTIEAFRECLKPAYKDLPEDQLPPRELWPQFFDQYIEFMAYNALILDYVAESPYTPVDVREAMQAKRQKLTGSNQSWTYFRYFIQIQLFEAVVSAHGPSGILGRIYREGGLAKEATEMPGHRAYAGIKEGETIFFPEAQKWSADIQEALDQKNAAKFYGLVKAKGARISGKRNAAKPIDMDEWDKYPTMDPQVSLLMPKGEPLPNLTFEHITGPAVQGSDMNAITRMRDVYDFMVGEMEQAKRDHAAGLQ